MSRGLNSYSNARDGNESEFVEMLCKMGITVTRHDQPWDLCCTYLDISRWAEVKMPANLKGEPKAYTKKQIKTLESWPNRRVDTLVTTKQVRVFADQLKADARLVRAARVAAE